MRRRSLRQTLRRRIEVDELAEARTVKGPCPSGAGRTRWRSGVRLTEVAPAGGTVDGRLQFSGVPRVPDGPGPRERGLAQQGDGASSSATGRPVERVFPHAITQASCSPYSEQDR
jgi:hypothetical protein